MFFNKKLTASERIEKAGTLATKGKHKKALAEYQLAIKENPQASQSHEIHGRMAPLFAKTKQFDEAWRSYKNAASGYKLKGFANKAISTYKQAAKLMPKKIDVWLALAGELQEKGDTDEAVKTLYEAHRHFRKSSELDTAIKLLLQAFHLDEWNFTVTMELARLLKRARKKNDAHKYLLGLVERTRGSELRKVRGRLLRLSPSPANFLNWTKALILGK